MDITQPDFIPYPWATNGQKASIPAQQTSAGNGRASWNTGFPIENTIPVSNGGVPANYQDFQGVLNTLSEFACYQQAGGMFTWSATIDYQNGARVLGSDGKAYISTGKTGPSTTVINPVGDTSGKWILDANMAQVSSAASAITQDYVTSGGYTISGDVTVNGTVNGGGLVHIAGNETISGTKTFASTISGNITGSASYATSAGQATKLTTARTVQTDLGATTSASFDGTANITPGVTGTLAVANGGTGVTTIADIQAGKDGDGNTITSTYVDKTTYEAEMAEKADINGYYSDMTVGNAEQLISDDYVTDSAPYNFRTAGGDADIGDREYDELVGGTLCWNQLVQDGDFPDGTEKWSAKSGSTLSISNGVATVATDTTDTYTTIYMASEYRCSIVEGHKYYIAADVSCSSGKVVFYPTGVTSQGGKQFSGNTTLTRCAWIYNPSTTVSGAQGQIRFPATDTSVAEAITGSAANYIIVDLTAMFGTVIAEHIYALEQANAGAGVAWFKKLFPKDWYAYNAGELMSVQAASHDMVGFNQLVTPTAHAINSNVAAETLNKNTYTHVIAGTQYQFSVSDVSGAENWRWVIKAFDLDGNLITDISRITSNLGFFYNTNWNAFINTANITHKTFTITFGFEGYVQLYIGAGGTTSATTVADACLHLVWSGYRNGEYEPYEKHSYPLDSTLTLRGIPKLDASNNLVYDGDIYESDGTVTRRYGIVDLGDGTWVNNIIADEPSVFCRTTTINRASTANYLCAKYVTNNTYAGALQDKQIGFRNSSNYQQIVIKDTAYTDAATFKAAMAGVYLVYELATPTTETAAPYQNPQIVSDFGTEEYVDAAVAAGTRDVAIPVGHETKYIANLVDKLRRLPDAPDAAGNYLVHYDASTRRASYTAYIGPTELPDAPGADGTYTLKATVADGVVTYSWEA